MKDKLKYGIVTALLFILPFSSYLLFEALFHSIDYDYIIYGEIADVTHYVSEDDIFVYSTDKETNYNGFITFNEELNTYGIELQDGEVIKVGNEYYRWNYEVGELEDVKVELIKEKRSYSIPAFVIFFLIGGLIAVLIISKKMEWHKKKPYEATILSLWITLGFLFAINFFISNIFKGFLVIAISFTLHYFWHIYSKGQISKKEADKKTSQLEDILKKALGDRL